jgi:hypothetical protein
MRLLLTSVVLSGVAGLAFFYGTDVDIGVALVGFLALDTPFAPF